MDGEFDSLRSAGSRRRGGVTAGLCAAVTILGLGLVSGVPQAVAAEAPVGLGTAGAYSVLGGQTVTNTGPSTLDRNLGVFPGTAITGFPPGTAAGATHAGDAVAQQAQSDLVVAYDDAAGRAPTANVAGDLVGQTLVGGVYKSTGPLAISGTLTLDGQGDSSTVWIFQVASTLITASASTVNLINGAQACHVFWQVGSSATLGTNSNFAGTIMALTSITATTGTVVAGRALARNGQVSLDDNTFTTGTCDTTPTTTPTTTAPTTTPPGTDSTTPTTSDTGTTSDTNTGTMTDTTSSPGSGTSSTAGAGLGTTRTDLDHTHGNGQPDNVPTGTSDLAGTGASPLLGPLVGLGALLLVFGGLLLAVAYRRRTRRRY
ncbi:ice-binding family protein [Amycolatopsis sp. NBC_00438]|uniref:ice-binding family protein n=1 Tax=Amycolatopsis sp. NBC_00438 TaxID=2903558 RepID=UPI002E22E34D